MFWVDDVGLFVSTATEQLTLGVQARRMDPADFCEEGGRCVVEKFVKRKSMTEHLGMHSSTELFAVNMTCIRNSVSANISRNRIPNACP